MVDIFNSKKHLEFNITKSHTIQPLDADELTVIGDKMEYKWYEFEFFDFIRSISRWTTIKRMIEYLDNFNIVVKYLSGETRTYFIEKEEDFKAFLKETGNKRIGIEEAYIEELNEENINDFVTYKYCEPHRLFTLSAYEDDFIKEYKNILAIADNDSIVEIRSLILY